MESVVGSNTTSNTTTTSPKSNTTQGVAKSIATKGKSDKATHEPQDAQESTEPKKYKFSGLKIKGQEQEIEADEEQVKRWIMQAHGANSAYHEAKAMQQDADKKYQEYEKWKVSQDEHKKKLHSNPIQAAIDAGASPQQVRQIAENWLLDQIRQDEMSPDAKRAMELEAELNKVREAEAKRKQDDEERELSAAAAEHRKKIVPEIMKYMDAHGLARTAGNLASVAKRLQMAGKRGVPLTVDQAVQATQRENLEFVRSTMGGQAKAINDAFKANDTDAVMAIGREVEQFLGEEILVALQRYGIVKFKTKTPRMPNQPLDTAKTKSVAEPTEMSYDEMVEQRKRRAIELDRARGIGVR